MKNAENMEKTSFMTISKAWFPLHQFSQNLEMVISITRSFSLPNFTQTDQEIYKVWVEIHLHPEVTMTITNPIFMKPILDWQLSTMNAYNKFS
jgi:hypothetical protein